MEHQLWTAILPLLVTLDQTPHPARHPYSDCDILAVYLWAVLHDRPQAWACDTRNWPIHRRRPLPSESTLSKRLRTPSAVALFAALFAALTTPSGPGVFWMLDGKPLPVSGVSGDANATWGRCAGGLACGYELHATLDIRGDIAACEVAPMDIDERVVAQRLLATAQLQCYVVADVNYDSNRLHDCCDATGDRQLTTPRRYARTAKSTGHRPRSAGRFRCLELWGQPAPRPDRAPVWDAGVHRRVPGPVARLGADAAASRPPGSRQTADPRATTPTAANDLRPLTKSPLTLRANNSGSLTRGRPQQRGVQATSRLPPPATPNR